MGKIDKCEPLSALQSSSRLMIFAPHPDDESLACGILLQDAVRIGAAIRVVYVTDGENNPWPQRFFLRRWQLHAADRVRWAKLRRREALAALGILGVARADAQFLGWPDQGLPRLLMSDRVGSLARLRHLIADWCPTDVFVPDVADRHRDHRALGVMFRLMVSGSEPCFQHVEQWSYVVHGFHRPFLRHAQALPQTLSQTETKRRAIGCHKTQLKLSRRRFMRYAASPELFLDISQRDANVDSASRDSCPAYWPTSPLLSGERDARPAVLAPD